MPLLSAGIAVVRRRPAPEVLIAHMGGPLWRGRQEAAWSFPKGLLESGEEPEGAARREFSEELGLPVPPGELVDLGTVRQPSGKRVRLWLLEADVDLTGFDPGRFDLEWPPRSGRTIEVPEVDEARWVPLDEAEHLLVKGQRPFLERIAALLDTA